MYLETSFHINNTNKRKFNPNIRKDKQTNSSIQWYKQMKQLIITMVQIERKDKSKLLGQLSIISDHRSCQNNYCYHAKRSENILLVFIQIELFYIFPLFFTRLKFCLIFKVLSQLIVLKKMSNNENRFLRCERIKKK